MDAGFIRATEGRREAGVGSGREDQGQEREGDEKRWLWMFGLVEL